MKYEGKYVRVQNLNTNRKIFFKNCVFTFNMLLYRVCVSCMCVCVGFRKAHSHKAVL